MLRKCLALIALTLPVVAFALDYTDVSMHYKDAPFSKPEAAAISVLTNWEVVSGDPDGSFHPKRNLNRAEFAKITALLVGEDAHTLGATNCFPDVHQEWFAVYVCFEKEMGTIKGNPDGFFHPERFVNYAEAVTMLARMYNYTTEARSDDAWFSSFLRAAEKHRTALPSTIQPGEFITRGLAVRLASAFIAESQSQLDLYRAAEHGEAISSPSSASLASSVPSVSAVTSVSSSSSAPALRPPDLPIRSHLLLLGERSSAIAAATFFPAQEPMYLRTVKVKLKDKIDAIDTMYLLDGAGKQLGTMSLDPFDTTDKTWKASLPSGAYALPKSENTILAVEALVKARGSGGSSERIIQADTFSATMEGQWSASMYNAAPVDSTAYPRHQTTQARVTEARNALAGNDTLPVGTNELIGAFSINGTSVPGALLLIEHLEFQINKSSSTVVSHWQLGTPDGPDRIECSVSAQTLSCLTIPPSIGAIGSSPRIFRIFGNVAIDQGSSNNFLQLSLNQPGTIGENGAIRFGDGTGHFTWTELSSPIARGTLWK